MDTVTHAASGAVLGMAVSQWILPQAMTSCIVLGVIAGSLPDLDFLAELRGKIAAWKYHRILSHNIPVASLLTLLLGVLTSYTQSLPLQWVLLLCISATALHLLLDVLTSFGTCLWFPFSSKRYSTRSHFIIDPFVLGICLYGLASQHAWPSIFTIALYIVLSLILKSVTYVFIKARLPAGLESQHLQLEPIFLAPFRWLVIVKTPEGYAYCYQNLIWQGPWYARDHEFSEFQGLCERHGLMRWVLKTFDMPLYQLQQHEGEYYLIVEDLKWRAEPGLRPLAFTLTLAKANRHWNIIEATQGGFFQRSNSGLFQPPTRWAHKETEIVDV